MGLPGRGQVDDVAGRLVEQVWSTCSAACWGFRGGVLHPLVPLQVGWEQPARRQQEADQGLAQD